MYDIIGDIHGHYDELHALLLGMGYTYDAKAHNFSHPTRTALLVSDLIDAGEDSLKVIRLVQNMVASGAARLVMGNHEFNAVLYTIENPDHPGEYLRKHNEDNRNQHSKFLKDVEHDPALYAEVIDWMKTIPVFFIHGDLHVVHACWDGDAIAELKALGAIDDKGVITPQGWFDGGRKGSDAYRCFETLLKGPEERLAPGLEFSDAYGRKRTKGRIKWWNENPQTYREAYSIPPSAKFIDDPYTPASAHSEATRIRDGLKNVALVAFGHYWMHGKDPKPLSDRAICVDWSVAKGGILAAYRYDGEKAFAAAKFYSVPKP